MPDEGCYLWPLFQSRSADADPLYENTFSKVG